jgi:hypothetical protein
MSTQARLTSRDRVNRMFAREDHDRVPRYETCWGETLDRWMAEGLEAGNREEAMERVLEHLDADLHSLCWYWPHPYPGREEVIREDADTRVIKGPSGTIERYWKRKSGTPEHIGWECDGRDVWENRYKPAMMEQGVTLDVEPVREQFAKARRAGKWSFLAGVSAFEVIRKVIGDEMFMMTLIDEPDWIEDMARVSTECVLRNYQAVLDAGVRPDGMWIYDDMAFKTMTFCSPAMYREIIRPQHKRLADFAHRNGMRMIFHSDGDLRGVIPDFIEAGIDCLQPLEAKASMDIRELAPAYGDRLALFGNVDVMQLLTNDLERIEREVTGKLAAGMATKGYIFHSDHSVPPQVSWDTYRHIIRLVERHGWY